MIDLTVDFKTAHFLGKLNAFPKRLGVAVKNLTSDVASSSPAIVGGAVSDRYAVDSLKAIKRKMPAGSKTKYTNRGDTIIRVHSSYHRAWGLESLISFTGSVFADWPITVNGGNRIPKPKIVRGSKREGELPRRVYPKYNVEREVLKGAIKTLTPEVANGRIFARKKGRNIRAYMAIPGKPKAFVIAGTSIPQAIAQPETEKIWHPKLMDLFEKRMHHAFDHVMKSFDENGKKIKQ